MRSWSLDPKMREFPDVSGYVAMGNNPINKIDKKGDLEENADGSLKEQQINKSTLVYLFTERGNKIEASKRGETNCAGYAFTGSLMYYMSTHEAEKILDDEYHQVNKNDIQVGDKVVFRTKKAIPGDEDIVKYGTAHYGTVVKVVRGEDGKITDVLYQYTDGKDQGKNSNKSDAVKVTSVKYGKYGKNDDFYREYYKKNEGMNPPRELKKETDYNE